MTPEKYYDTVAIVIIVMCSLSLVGGTVVILSYIIVKKLRNFALKMVVYLCFSDVLTNISLLFIPPNILNFRDEKFKVTTLCTIQSMMQSWGDLSSIMWSGLISVVIYLTVVQNINVNTLKKYEYIFLIIGFLFPLIISSLPFLTDSYGEDTYFCWIKSRQSSDLAMKLIVNYGPLWATFIVITVLNTLTSNKIKNLEFLTQGQQKSLKKMLIYPYILIITSFWGSIVGIMELSNYQIPQFLQILHHLFSRSLGLLNALIYGLTPVVRSQLRNYLSHNKSSILQQNTQYNSKIDEPDEQQEKQLDKEDIASNGSSDKEDAYKYKNSINESDSDNDFLQQERKNEKLHEVLL